MAKRKEGVKICFVCSKFVDTNKNKDHYVLVKTGNREISKDDETYFHFQCYVQWFMNKVSERAKIQVREMQQQVMKMVNNPMIKGILSQVQGSGQLMGMLETPLTKSKINKVEIIASKIQDGRNKKGKKRKHKAKMQ